MGRHGHGFYIHIPAYGCPTSSCTQQGRPFSSSATLCIHVGAQPSVASPRRFNHWPWGAELIALITMLLFGRILRSHADSVVRCGGCRRWWRSMSEDEAEDRTPLTWRGCDPGARACSRALVVVDWLSQPRFRSRPEAGSRLSVLSATTSAVLLQPSSPQRGRPRHLSKSSFDIAQGASIVANPH